MNTSPKIDIHLTKLNIFNEMTEIKAFAGILRSNLLQDLYTNDEQQHIEGNIQENKANDS